MQSDGQSFGTTTAPGDNEERELLSEEARGDMDNPS